MPETNKTVHTHLRSISRVNTLLAISALIAVALLYMWFKWSLLPASQASEDAVEQSIVLTEQKDAVDQEARQTVESVDQEELGAEYRAGVNELLAEYAFDEAGTATDVLPQVLELVVPGSIQAFHLDLVIALTEAQKGNFDSAQESVRALAAEYAWFETAVE